MIDFDTTQRLIRLQERLRTATYHEIRKDGHHKSSEGAVSIAFCLPAVVSDERDPTWVVEVYSYVLGSGSESFFGKTAAEAVSKAEDAAKRMCFSAEMEMFSINFNEPQDDGTPPDHASDCAANNAPAEAAGTCDCGLGPAET